MKKKMQNNYKIITVVGTRPQLIKAACVSDEFKKHRKISEIILHTGQHYSKSMSEFFFTNFKKNFKLINLHINNSNHSKAISKMLSKLSDVFVKLKPNLILLYGDTNSTLSGALAANRLKIPIAHIEGGLRNFDLSIAEDVNRIITDRISNLIFYSTKVAERNLSLEGYKDFPCKLVKTDDLLSDSVIKNIKYARKESDILDRININISKRKFVLLTIHREKSLSYINLKNIFKAINKISLKRLIIFPIHPNTNKNLKKQNIKLSSNIFLIPPVNYFDMLKLLDTCEEVITDSGGLQREAYILKKRSLLILGYTPWEELITSKCAITSNFDTVDIVNKYNKLLLLKSNFSEKLYGSGKGSKKIVTEIIKFLKKND